MTFIFLGSHEKFFLVLLQMIYYIISPWKNGRKDAICMSVLMQKEGNISKWRKLMSRLKRNKTCWDNSNNVKCIIWNANVLFMVFSLNVQRRSSKEMWPLCARSFTVSQLKYFSFLGLKNVKSVYNVMEIKGREINAPFNSWHWN